MRINFNQFTSNPHQQLDQKSPLPGEIWQISCSVQTPLEFSTEEQHTMYSEIARRFLEGNSPPRYGMIVSEPELLETEEENWKILSVMLFSEQTDFQSNVDILLPAEVSGLKQDVLALTWQVQFMLACNLSHPVGKRLSRKIYDVLLNIGDYYHNLVEKPPSKPEIESLGLQMGNVCAKQDSKIAEFHRLEMAWTDVLKVPLDAYRTYQKTMNFTGKIIDAALELERELAISTQKQVALGQWLRNIFEAEWLSFEEFLRTQPANLAWNVRSAEDSHQLPLNQTEITRIIAQLSSEQDEHQRRRAAKRLGEIGLGDENAIRALVNLLQTTNDDETLWTAVESLWQIDPTNPAAGTRRVKLINWGMQVVGNAVALTVALVQKANGKISVLIRVYPNSNSAYLPPHLKLILLSEFGGILREVTARESDLYIQLRLNGQPGERFSVKVALGEGSLTEDFVI
ncbi:MAG: DUF1822 family protein [Lyngbya sp.]|nr:DUF1822 family protein [Lyngbya sp.]